MGGVIPAYKPEHKLVSLVNEILKLGFLHALVVVDDAGGPEYQPIFDEIERMGVRVLHHGVNLGMGGAIKTGLQYLLFHEPRIAGFVTFDADGQHLLKDIAAVVREFQRTPNRLVLGVRDFHDSAIRIPLRSKFGNRLTELIFWGFTGTHLKDTQTGLRCYPRIAAERIVSILRNRYEFQLEALLVNLETFPMTQIRISTVYEDGNRCSHFNPVVDSIRIYAVFLRFILTSLICSITDYIIFAFLLLLGHTLWISLISARVFSVLLNFVLARNKVFHSRGTIKVQLVKFLLLASLLFTASYFSIDSLDKMGVPPLLSKVLIEPTLFLCSFFVQRLLIFIKKEK